jgi:hypothetical protein
MTSSHDGRMQKNGTHIIAHKENMIKNENATCTWLENEQNEHDNFTWSDNDMKKGNMKNKTNKKQKTILGPDSICGPTRWSL